MSLFSPASPSPFFRNKTIFVYSLFSLAALILFKILDTGFISSMIDTFFSFFPFLLILGVSLLSYFKYASYKKAAMNLPHIDGIREKIRIQTFQTIAALLGITLFFYLLVSPESYSPVLSSLVGFFSVFLSLSSFFLILSLGVSLLLLGGVVLVTVKYFQTRNTAQFPEFERFRKKLLNASFAVVLSLLLFSFAAFADAYRPLVDYSVNSLASLIGGGHDQNLSLVSALSQTASALRKDVTQSRTELSSGLSTSKEDFEKALERASVNVTGKLTEELKQKLANDGGVLSGNLIVKGTLDVLNQTTLRDLIPEKNDLYNIGSSSKGWNELFVNRINGMGGALQIGSASFSHSIKDEGGLLVEGDAEINGTLYADGRLLLSRIPTEGMEAATKDYVDSQIGTESFLERSGAVISPKTTGDDWDFEGGDLSGIVNLSLTGSLSAGTLSAGTITGGIWNGNTLDVAYGGTGLTAAPANGQLPIGNGTGYTLGTITGTSNQITVTNGSGTITLSLPQAINTTSSPTFAGLTLTNALSPANGGTGVTSFGGTNRLLYTTSTDTLSSIATGNNKVLITNGSGVPDWANISGDTFTQYALLGGRSGGQALIGGSAVTDVLSLQGTSGNGTAGNAAIKLNVGNNGGTTALTILNNGNVGFNSASPSSLLTLASTASLESAVLGSELASTGWTTTDWTGSFAAGFTHTTGNTTSLTNTLAAVTNNLYQISYTVTGRTAGSFTINFGGESNSGLTATGAWGPKATSTGTFSIAPTTDFNGTIVISVKQITGTYSPTYAILNSAGSASFEIRSTTNGLGNTFIGVGAGRYNTTGYNNSAEGYQALYSNTTGNSNSAQGHAALYYNTTGSNNSAQGYRALTSNTTGSYNSAQGAYALYSNTTGSYNSAQGMQALVSNTTGSNNSALGVSALHFNTTGSSNSAQGYQALNSNTTGSNNSALGYRAGRYISGGSVANATSSNSLYLGASTMALADGDTNEIVIGYNATGLGSNTAVLGNDSIVTTVLKGNVGVGLNNPATRFDVYADTASNYAAKFANDGNNVNRYGLLVQAGLDDGAAAGPSTLVQFNDGDGGAIGSISFGSNATSYNTSSDIRLKENIAPTLLSLDDLMKISVRDYTWKNDPEKTTVHGLIAQELAAIYPQAVTVPANPEALWMIDYGKLTPLLIKAVQDQQGIIGNLSLDANTNETSLITLKLSVDQELSHTKEMMKALEQRLQTLESSVTVSDASENSPISDPLTSDPDRLLALEDSLQATEDRLLVLETGNQVLLDFYTNLNLGNIPVVLNGTLDLGGVKVIVESLEAKETVSAKNVESERVESETGEVKDFTADTISVKNTDPDRKTLGTATIREGETSVTVETKAVTEGSRVFVTPKISIKNSLAVTEQNEGESFTVSLSEEAEKDTLFSWWILEESTPAPDPES